MTIGFTLNLQSILYERVATKCNEESHHHSFSYKIYNELVHSMRTVSSIITSKYLEAKHY